ncbi:MAG: hypothetical protein ACQET5_01990 [Halobacteriota archaeon]
MEKPDSTRPSGTWDQIKPRLSLTIERFEENPLITSANDGELGENINGPSVIEVPEWIDDPLGKYYMYFAHHEGEFIRLAYADSVRGPWKIYSPGTLHRRDTRFTEHIASPDVHVDAVEERIRMYFHGCCGPFEHHSDEMEQVTDVAVSSDGIGFDVCGHTLGNSYFRVWGHKEAYYAVANDGYLYSSADPFTPFRRRQQLFQRNRHFALCRVRPDLLQLFLTRRGDRPERVMTALVDISVPVADWEPHPHPPHTVLWPEKEYEGTREQLTTSQSGAVYESVNALRDPATLRTDGSTYLFYVIAGERGIAGSEVVKQKESTQTG